ncbi:DUF3572 domain-containing protein [Aquabacter spiritensis]|uniref:Uncharacterized protein DUF3572 n=1 Tax=Aquabacter spiritensis TaxID=933073 RepID=A0A4R3LL23_9HYPH|nr:DUF3572 domain-containing protein [Aquabacter spiritensis]TCT00992.1 uncharacterized protein DUF3572 [Aquabacter spiritensis]
MPIRDKTSSSTPLRTRDAAQAVAIEALAFLAEDMERIGGFLAQSGLSPGDLRARAAEPDFAAAVLAFILSDEPMLIAFSAKAKLRPQDVLTAHAVLDPPFDPDAPARRH